MCSAWEQSTPNHPLSHQQKPLSHRPRAERPWSYSLGLALSLAQLAIFALAGAREHKLPGFARNMPLGAGFFAFCVLSDWAMQSRHFPKKRGLKTA